MAAAVSDNSIFQFEQLFSDGQSHTSGLDVLECLHLVDGSEQRKLVLIRSVQFIASGGIASLATARL